MIRQFISHSTDETEKIGAMLAGELIADGKPLIFIAMRGELGSGKTAFVRGFASVASPGSRVKSPTYTLVNEYRNGIRPLFHFDLYRGGDSDTLESIGFDEYTDTGDCLIEWSENMDGFPEGAIVLTIEKLSINERLITLEA